MGVSLGQKGKKLNLLDFYAELLTPQCFRRSYVRKKRHEQPICVHLTNFMKSTLNAPEAVNNAKYFCRVIKPSDP